MVSHSGLITVMQRAARKAAPRLRRDFGEVEQLQVSKKGALCIAQVADEVFTCVLICKKVVQRFPQRCFVMSLFQDRKQCIFSDQAVNVKAADMNRFCT